MAAGSQRAWRASSAETVAQGFVVAVLGVPLVLGVEVVRGLRALRARARRWPMPPSIGCLTNSEIDDRLP